MVLHGLQLWRQIWFKTANLSFFDESLLEWTYKINIKIDWRLYHWVWAYIKSKWLFESHIFDFDRDIYWKEIIVYVLEKIRDNKIFETLDDMKNQISKDVEFAKTNKIKIMTFGTFDILHEWHKYFLIESKSYWDLLITIVARDKNVLWFKKELPYNDENTRLLELNKIGISDLVELWDLDNPFNCIEKYSPQVICLWYDQRWFSEELLNIERFNNIEICRIPPYFPEKYKSSLLKSKL